MPMITVPPTEEELWRAADIREALSHLRAALAKLSDDEIQHKRIIERAVTLLKKREQNLEAGSTRWVPGPDEEAAKDPYAEIERARARARAEGRTLVIRTGD